jgi:16S rRNA (cytosine1402-N4)-methyltransferase
MSEPPRSFGVNPHLPVMLAEVVDALAPGDGETYVDGTFGAGGYSEAILCAARCSLIAIDRDPTAIARGREIEARAGGRLTLVEGEFAELDAIARRAGVPISGVVLDIGVSSMQLDDAGRGFSFMADGPLDMRMAAADGHPEPSAPSAAELLASLEADQIADILFHYGEERRSRAIARAIVKAREERPLTRTGDLARLVERVLGRERDGKHPATRTFQALRIAVNDELGQLVAALAAAEAVLAPGGRLVVVTFHSLEDRIVKRFLTERTGRTSGGSRHMPQVEAASAPSFRFVNPRPLTPSNQECAANPRARSAKLRWAVRTEAPAFPLDRSALGLPQVAF